VRVIGVGNPFRCDDGIGPLVAREVKKRVPHLEVMEASGEGAELMELWAGAETVIVIDAVSSEAKPGVIYRFEAHREALPAFLFSGSTHRFGVAQAVELARALGKLPKRVIVYGIEGKSFRFGTELSPEVEAVVETAARRVLEEE